MMKVFAPVVAAVLFAASTVAVEPPNPPIALKPLAVNPVLTAPTICEELQLTWQGGIPPYIVTVVQVLSDLVSDSLEEFSPVTTTSFNWVVNLTTFSTSDFYAFNVVDGSGQFNQSASFSIQDASDHSCVNVQTLVVNTPLNGTVCEPLTFTWSGGIPPYTLTIAQLITATVSVPIEEYIQIGWSFSPVINLSPIPGGDSFILNLADGANHSSQSSVFHIHDSTDHSCLAASSTFITSTATETNPPIASSSSISTTSESTTKSSIIGEGKIVGIGLGLLAALLLLAIWRVYVLRTRRRRAGDRENLGLDQKFQLSPIQNH